VELVTVDLVRKAVSAEMSLKTTGW
jgi:hypothetical protein